MKALGIPGLAVAVIKNGKRVKVSTYGTANLEWNRPVTIHTNFQIASCTKLLTSTLVLKAVYAGKLRFEDPIGKYLDSIPTSWQALRVQHLLSHTSGLREFRGDTYASTATVVRALQDSTLEYVPGTSQHYAQADFMLAGHILEKIYGKPFPQILREEVLLPLHMTDGAYDMERRVGSIMRTDLIPQKATTYYDWEKQLRAYKFIYPQYSYTAGDTLPPLTTWQTGPLGWIRMCSSRLPLPILCCIRVAPLAGSRRLLVLPAGACRRSRRPSRMRATAAARAWGTSGVFPRKATR
ncbi:beta-lactamase family protein [Hymenobacter cellulosilyticus]|uniref:Beta-lactamase family protein n=1 Tax=Hymenobacter cellulosilyticus TaxID=2932248 RepID=A0A8T9Q603_9BACT|nr:serine hydrolase domain-containing protein [Hymenobacter cellulosilyticus]UOQ70503.1 beta-lactamase family protein [Hymenobacter cellulosilyticus]